MEQARDRFEQKGRSGRSALGNPSGFGNCPLWLARYNSTRAVWTESPAMWTRTIWRCRSPSFVRATASKGKVIKALGSPPQAASRSACAVGSGSWRLYCRGEQPMTRLNAVLKALSDS